MASSGAIKVLQPKLNEKINGSAVTVRFQLQNTSFAPDPSPTFRIQLDARDPVEIMSNEHSFTGLPAGDHVITIELVDANRTPVAGSQTEVRFTTTTPGASGPRETSRILKPPVMQAKLERPETHSDQELPSGSSELPLLSMVGFGVLVGGVISAMRTRR